MTITAQLFLRSPRLDEPSEQFSKAAGDGSEEQFKEPVLAFCHCVSMLAFADPEANRLPKDLTDVSICRVEVSTTITDGLGLFETWVYSGPEEEMSALISLELRKITTTSRGTIFRPKHAIFWGSVIKAVGFDIDEKVERAIHKLVEKLPKKTKERTPQEYQTFAQVLIAQTQNQRRQKQK